MNASNLSRTIQTARGFPSWSSLLWTPLISRSWLSSFKCFTPRHNQPRFCLWILGAHFVLRLPQKSFCGRLIAMSATTTTQSPRDTC